MPLSQNGINESTPMGATVLAGGTSFRVWAGNASAVYLVLDAGTSYTPSSADLLVRLAKPGHWAGFVANVGEGRPYRFWVVGEGGQGFKRDPHARELRYLDGVVTPDYDNSNCVVRSPRTYHWAAPHFRPPRFHELVVYQFHVGVFYGRDSSGQDIRGSVAKLLHAAERVPYLADLGVNAVQPLPFVEFWTENSLGYNGTDLFSPEMDYCMSPAQLDESLPRLNALLTARGASAKTRAELEPHPNQLKLFIDLCHLYGIAVLVDVVYNHAGPSFNAQSIEHFDLPPHPSQFNKLYFDKGGANWVGPVFDYSSPDVREFLLDNARMFLNEYKVDGFRFDEVRVIGWNGGWRFLQDMTSTLRFVNGSAVLIAEFWDDVREGAVRPREQNGAGFDVEYEDRFRGAIREVLAEVAGGASARVSLDRLRDALYPRLGRENAWRSYNCIENHDLEDDNHAPGEKEPRVAALAGGNDARSWYATSRARVATSLLLSSPGIPMLFMGQEFLEHKYWSDNPRRSNLFIDWAGLEGGHRAMRDFHRFVRDLCWLRRQHAALTGGGVNVFHVHNENRVLAIQRWAEGMGQDVVVVASFSERTYYGKSYRIGFPAAGHWDEIFNSDIYEHYFNHDAQGNYGGIDTDPQPLHGFSQSAGITLPANGVVMFARR